MSDQVQRPIHLTKSNFIRGYDCSMRLRHALDRVPSTLDGDQYLRLLAEGGFQFETLVRAGWPGESLHLGRDEPVAAAEATMARLRVLRGSGGVLHEAVFVHGDCMARIDMVRVEGDRLLLCEIKAKAVDGPAGGQSRGHAITDLDAGMLTSRTVGVASKWRRYLADVAFQTVVVERALAAAGLGDLKVVPRLVVANRSAVAGEFDHFGNIRLRAESVGKDHLSDEDFEFVNPPPAGYLSPLVLEVDVSEGVRRLREVSAQSEAEEWRGLTLEALIESMAAILRGGDTSPGRERGWKCRDCEFRSSVDRDGRSVESGFDRCWGDGRESAAALMELYRGGGYQPNGCDAETRWVDSFIASHAGATPLTVGGLPLDGGEGVRAVTRNLQIEAARSGGTTTSADFVATVTSRLMGHPDGCVLHFIDFETATSCLPFEPGMRAYEVVAFQFSCHSLRYRSDMGAGQSAVHRSWLDPIGVGPEEVRDPRTLDRTFVDQLRRVIGHSDPVYHWSAHERTVLRTIAARLEPGVDGERIEWIDELLGDGGEQSGRLVDMLRVAEGRIMSPAQHGRYSIKHLLPAACREDIVWASLCNLMDWNTQFDRLAVDRDPYAILPPLAGSLDADGSAADDEAANGAVSGSDGVRCGTDAIRAFQQLRYGSASSWGRVDAATLRESLETYCRLDTAAMVGIWEWMVARVPRPVSGSGEESQQLIREDYYDAFISYRHVDPDRKWAERLHRSLETYRIPRRIVREAGVPARLRRVFRDEEELPASSDLSREIDIALRESRFLIVICSPRTPESKWVGQEIERFRALGRGDRILALLIDGEPAESFPRALCEIRRTIVSPLGGASQQIEEREPLAADVRDTRSEGKRYLYKMALMRFMAAMVGCRFDDLKQREAERASRRRVMVAATATALSVAFAGVAGIALYQQNRATQALGLAEEQRYASQVQLAQSLIEQGRLSDARRLLEETDPSHRHFEHDHLLGSIDPSTYEWQLEHRPLAIWDGDDDGRPEAIVTELGLQRDDGSTIAWDHEVTEAEFFDEGRYAWAWKRDGPDLLVANCETGTVATVRVDDLSEGRRVVGIARAVGLKTVVALASPPANPDQAHIVEYDPQSEQWTSVQLTGDLMWDNWTEITAVSYSAAQDELLIAGYGFGSSRNPARVHRSTGVTRQISGGYTGITAVGEEPCLGARIVVAADSDRIVWAADDRVGVYAPCRPEVCADASQSHYQISLHESASDVSGLMSIAQLNQVIVWDQRGTVRVIGLPDGPWQARDAAGEVCVEYGAKASVTSVSTSRRGVWMFIGDQSRTLQAIRLQNPATTAMTAVVNPAEGVWLDDWSAAIAAGKEAGVIEVVSAALRRPSHLDAEAEGSESSSASSGRIGARQPEYAIDHGVINLASGQSGVVSKAEGWLTTSADRCGLGVVMSGGVIDAGSPRSDPRTAESWCVWRPDLGEFTAVKRPHADANWAVSLSGTRSAFWNGAQVVVTAVDGDRPRELARIDPPHGAELAGVGSAQPIVAFWNPTQSRHSIWRDGRVVSLPYSAVAGAVAFSADDQRCAIWLDEWTIGVIMTDTGALLLSLEASMTGGSPRSLQFAIDDSCLWVGWMPQGAEPVRGSRWFQVQIRLWLGQPMAKSRSDTR